MHSSLQRLPEFMQQMLNPEIVVEPPKQHERASTPQDHWLKAHAYDPEWTESAAREKYGHWEATIPNLSCSCRAEWRKIVKANAPVFSSAYDYYRWFWERHNDVNAKIREEKGGHPHVEWSDCCRLYGYPEEWLEKITSHQWHSF